MWGNLFYFVFMGNEMNIKFKRWYKICTRVEVVCLLGEGVQTNSSKIVCTVYLYRLHFYSQYLQRTLIRVSFGQLSSQTFSNSPVAFHAPFDILSGTNQVLLQSVFLVM